MSESDWKRAAPIRFAYGFLRGLAMYRKYRHRTMIGWRAYAENLAMLHVVLANPALAKGAVVECGTWRGGMSAGLIEMAGRERRYFFFDSYEGLPPAQDIDGDKAKSWQSDRESPAYYNNCAASLDEFKATLAMIENPPKDIAIHKGFFETTLPAFESPALAVLRLDGDWYESTMTCLEKFWDCVMPDGLILIDDYYAWEGCSKAVHDFLSKRKASERIYQGPIGRTAFIIKKKA